jgi:PRC-barrel domain
LTLGSGHHRVEVAQLTGDELLALPVRLHGIELGRPADVLLDRDGLRAVGLDVICGDDVHRFLPLTTALVSSDGLHILSPLVLLEEDELDFYRSRTFALSSLRGRPVQRRGRDLGKLRDIVVTRDGSLRSIVLDGGQRIPFEDALQLAPPRRTAA